MRNDELAEPACASARRLFPQFIIHHSSFIIYAIGMLKRLLAAVYRRIPVSLRRGMVLLTQPRFTVTAGAVVVNEEGRVLLVKHVFRPGSGWGVPGGFINKGEQAEAAARRELREEIGLELDRIELAFVRTVEQVNQLEIIFRCRAGGTPRPRNIEIHRVAWFELDQLPDDLPQAQRQTIQRALQADGPAKAG
jgi:8-oxo-dGTP diphosphatase